MSQYLRAFLFDSTQTSGDRLIENIFTTWSNGQAVTIIPSNFPKSQIDTSVIRCDPSEVLDLNDNSVHRRNLAIVDTPDLAAVVLTSGTTGDPLPVELGFSSMRNSTESLYKRCELFQQDTWLCCLPAHYIAGLAILARCFVSGSKLVFHETFDTERVRKSTQGDSITAISLVATQLRRLIKDNVDLSNLHTILVGGGPFDEELKRKCDELSLNVYSTYGMTETWGGICLNGKFLDNTKGRIVESELEISTNSLMLGYRHNYPATIAKLTPDHWYKTRDLGEITNDRLRILGRLDDIINSGGIKVDPVPLEDTIRALFPGFELYIVSTQHKDLGESTTVCFLNSEKPIPQLNEIRTALIEHLPSTHMPTRLAIVDNFPKTSSGKLQTSQLASTCKVLEEHAANLDVK